MDEHPLGKSQIPLFPVTHGIVKNDNTAEMQNQPQDNKDPREEAASKKTDLEKKEMTSELPKCTLASELGKLFDAPAPELPSSTFERLDFSPTGQPIKRASGRPRGRPCKYVFGFDEFVAMQNFFAKKVGPISDERIYACIKHIDFPITPATLKRTRKFVSDNFPEGVKKL